MDTAFRHVKCDGTWVAGFHGRFAANGTKGGSRKYWKWGIPGRPRAMFYKACGSAGFPVFCLFCRKGPRPESSRRTGRIEGAAVEPAPMAI